MATEITRARRPGEAILSEANGARSRGIRTVAASQDFPANTLLAKVTAGGAIVAFDPGAEDGSETPIAMAIYPVTTGAGETKDVAVIESDAELMSDCIAWPSGITTPQQAAAASDLAALGIKLR